MGSLSDLLAKVIAGAIADAITPGSISELFETASKAGSKGAEA